MGTGDYFDLLKQITKQKQTGTGDITFYSKIEQTNKQAKANRY